MNKRVQRTYSFPRGMHRDRLTGAGGQARTPESHAQEQPRIPVHFQFKGGKAMNVSKSLLFLALAGVSGAAGASDAGQAPEPAAFVKKAAQAGMTEVEAGRVALAKSQDPSIRSFAERMVADH